MRIRVGDQSRKLYPGYPPARSILDLPRPRQALCSGKLIKIQYIIPPPVMPTATGLLFIPSRVSYEGKGLPQEMNQEQFKLTF